MSMKYSIVTMSLLSMAMSGCGEGQDAAQTSRAAEKVAAQAERQIEKASVMLDDAAITAKVKTALIIAPELQGLAINVDTLGKVVTLSGTVASDGLRQQAETIAKGVYGVQEVKNNLIVKQPT